MYYRNHYSPSLFPTSWASDWGEDDSGLWMTLSYKGEKLTFRWIIPNTFVMGSPKGEKGRTNEEDLHEVTLTKGFWMADAPVTQGLWQAVMKYSTARSRFEGKNLPVDSVSWRDARLFIQSFNQLHPELSTRLPWEAEWEYACRAGSTTAFHFGNEIGLNQANYQEGQGGNLVESALEQTSPIKTYPANPWGLYDLHGNVWEWCEDEFKKHLGFNHTIDPKIGESLEVSVKASDEIERSMHVLRGGSCLNEAKDCRSASRNGSASTGSNFITGFRLAIIY